MSRYQYIRKCYKLISDIFKSEGKANKAAAVASNTTTSALKNSLHEIQAELLRSQIGSKWSVIDAIYATRAAKSLPRQCPLCAHNAPDQFFPKMQSYCIFGGGDLLRHLCPKCNLVFGPDKMFDLTSLGLAEEYTWHYKAYREGDSTESEIRTFHKLEPSKNGTYLNYGAGNWSNTMQILRSQGWNVYAYEPHGSASFCDKYDWVIDTKQRLSEISFDGIFSNNVLEHLRNPVQELHHMSTLLNKNGTMAHATPCYEYLYEYTRFHLFFFAGKSKDLLLEKAGLQLVDELIDGSYHCRVAKPFCYGTDV